MDIITLRVRTGQTGISIVFLPAHAYIEGELGLLEEVEYVEGRVLTVKGENGVLRIDICKESLFEALSLKKKEKKRY